MLHSEMCDVISKHSKIQTGMLLRNRLVRGHRHRKPKGQNNAETDSERRVAIPPMWNG